MLNTVNKILFLFFIAGAVYYSWSEKDYSHATYLLVWAALVKMDIYRGET